MYTCFDYLIFILYDIAMAYELLLLVVEWFRTLSNVLESCLRGQNMDCMAAHACADTKQIYVVYKICLCLSSSFTILS
jgi:hypothetical protein